MDEVATSAGVSKQTVYKQFTDKESLFREIVTDVTRKAEATATALTHAFGESQVTTTAALEARLCDVARVYLDQVLRPPVLALRRLVIAEAEQFPDLAADYFRQGPERGIDTVARCLQPYFRSGLLAADSVRTAAAQFAYLVLAVALDRALFFPTDLPDAKERERLAQTAARTFVGAYRSAG